ncbi:MAG: hypothetical protein K9M57_09120, partial [Phycisphaerae bacterium]|nr:hypothetical protein [Phycisphaerae bacterium]
MKNYYHWTKTVKLNCFAALIILFTISMSRCVAGDFWTPDNAGRISHTWSGDESLVMCLQGRAVVMQVRLSTARNLSYTFRFFNVKEDYFKNITYQAGSELYPAVQINGQPLKWHSPQKATFDGMLT